MVTQELYILVAMLLALSEFWKISIQDGTKKFGLLRDVCQRAILGLFEFACTSIWLTHLTCHCGGWETSFVCTLCFFDNNSLCREMTPLQRYSSLNGQGLDFILFSAVYQDDLAGPFVSQPGWVNLPSYWVCISEASCKTKNYAKVGSKKPDVLIYSLWT